MAGRDPLAYCGLNLVGLRRRGFSNEKIEEIQNIYRTLYMSGLNVSQAIAKIKETFAETEECKVVLDFLEGSERGIIPSIVK
jgi:UDP-N-acetylglucosamine acyltransferase